MQNSSSKQQHSNVNADRFHVDNQQKIKEISVDILYDHNNNFYLGRRLSDGLIMGFCSKLEKPNDYVNSAHLALNKSENYAPIESLSGIREWTDEKNDDKFYIRIFHGRVFSGSEKSSDKNISLISLSLKQAMDYEEVTDLTKYCLKIVYDEVIKSKTHS